MGPHGPKVAKISIYIVYFHIFGFGIRAESLCSKLKNRHMQIFHADLHSDKIKCFHIFVKTWNCFVSINATVIFLYFTLFYYNKCAGLLPIKVSVLLLSSLFICITFASVLLVLFCISILLSLLCSMVHLMLWKYFEVFTWAFQQSDHVNALYALCGSWL